MKATEAIVCVAILLIMIASLFMVRSCQTAGQRACRERGGRVVEVNSLRDPWAWSCVEPEPR